VARRRNRGMHRIPGIRRPGLNGTSRPEAGRRLLIDGFGPFELVITFLVWPWNGFLLTRSLRLGISLS
jgi:hypothetical protein